jgi:hypothetical protein
VIHGDTGSCGSVQISWVEQRQNRASTSSRHARSWGQRRSASRTLPRQDGPPPAAPDKRAPPATALLGGALAGSGPWTSPLYRRAVPGHRHGGTPAPYLFKPCAPMAGSSKWHSEADARLGQLTPYLQSQLGPDPLLRQQRTAQVEPLWPCRWLSAWDRS